MSSAYRIPDIFRMYADLERTVEGFRQRFRQMTKLRDA
jgi:hypothetical protein